MPEKVAVLVDGDNVSGKHATQIVTLARAQGIPAILRTYTDAKRVSDWHAASPFRLIHAGCGKNAADILLALDAMELALTQGITRFVIATSDGDFTHLAQRLREYGAQVTGIGEAKTPLAYRECCHGFCELAPPSLRRPIAAASATLTSLDTQIREMIDTNSQSKTGMPIAVLGQKMHAHHGIRIRTRPERTWRAYLEARPLLFDLDPRGPQARVRCLTPGFAQAA